MNLPEPSSPEAAAIPSPAVVTPAPNKGFSEPSPDQIQDAVSSFTQEKDASQTDVSSDSPTDPLMPDWKQRYEELQTLYLDRFSPPKVGQRVRVQLSSGRELQGVLTSLSDSELGLQISHGTILYPKDALHSLSVKDFYASDFAEYYALRQATVEYNAWMREHAPRQFTSIPRQQPQKQVRQTQVEMERDSPTTEERIPMFPIPPELLGR